MLPLSEIPGELTADFTGYQGELYSYTTSYHGREKPEKGDFVLLSLDKKGEIWKLVWPPYELSGTDPQTLELLPEKEKTNTAAAWEIFIRSGGSINDFFFRRKQPFGKYSAGGRLRQKGTAVGAAGRNGV